MQENFDGKEFPYDQQAPEGTDSLLETSRDFCLILFTWEYLTRLTTLNFLGAICWQHILCCSKCIPRRSFSLRWSLQDMARECPKYLTGLLQFQDVFTYTCICDRKCVNPHCRVLVCASLLVMFIQFSLPGLDDEHVISC